MRTLETLDFTDKTALIRVDFNVPLDANQHITDDTRIKAALPTINYILDAGGAVVLMSHLGRPKGVDSAFSLQPVAEHLAVLLDKPVEFIPDCIDPRAEEIASEIEPGDIVVLENLRFYSEEKSGDIDFAKKLAIWGDVYVNDAFGTAHRAHASTAVIAQFFPGKKSFGKLLENELQGIDKLLNSSKKPVTAIIGGAKVSSKIGIIENLLPRIDHLIIGGGMTYTFIKANGGSIGDSLVEVDFLETAREVQRKAKEKGVTIHLAADSLVADAFANDAKTQVEPSHKISDGWMGLDIGPKAISSFSEVVLASKTILLNGPLGVFEMPSFSAGTRELIERIAEATSLGAFSLVGGGDSVAAVNQMGFADKVSYVSTGGGAMLESLEGKLLPGVKAIMD